MFRAILGVFAIGLVLTFLAAASAQATTIRIADIDGTVPIGASDYVNGLNSVGNANYIASNLASYDALGSNVTIRITMGQIVDYFRPTAGTTLLQMLTSNSRHLWSASETGPYIAPVYFPGFDLLGGSTVDWPRNAVPGDNRAYLSFWGANNGSTPGGCCVTSNVGGGAWGQAFTMDVIAPVPLPAGLPLLAAGFGVLGMLGWTRRKSRAA